MSEAKPSSIKESETTTELASALRISVMRLARRLRRQRSDDTLSLTQLAALGSLDRHGRMTPGELAAHERVQPPSMTRVITVLEDHGLVIREPHATDGRQVLLTVSDKGRELLQADRLRRDAWLARRLADLDAGDLATLREAATILDRLASE